jgi:hypothetical protein
MKNVKFLVLGLASLSIALVGCQKDEPVVQPVSYVEDGFYVVGEATAVANLSADGADMALMAVGVNENDGNNARTGMYEKYVALEGGKPFSLVQKAGVTETQYGATLAKEAIFTVDEEGAQKSLNEQPIVEIYKGTLAANSALQVAESGLYHIIVDVELNTVIVTPVEWGVRGAMNGWGFTAFTKPTFSKTSMKYTLTNVEVAMPGGFKFAYGSGWKLELNPDGTPLVKANTNLGNEGGEENKNQPLTAQVVRGGQDIGIERGVYTIELEWTLAKGAIRNSYTAKVTKTGEVALRFPENLYMIGNNFGGWNWGSGGVVEMVPVWGVQGAFWCVNYFTAGNGFKWNSKKDWGGDFATLGTNVGYEVADNNAVVAENGLYTVYIDLAAEKITIAPAKVYGIGDCFGGWDKGQFPFALNEDGNLLSKATTGQGELRMYVDLSEAAVDTDGWDWWKSEFIILNGRIAYRGNGNDQERVSVAPGKTVTLDFEAGMGVIE